MKKQSLHIELFIVFLLLYVAYLILNVLTPLMIDDCYYASHGHSIKEIFYFQLNHYMTWSGRAVAHSISQIFGGVIGKPFFNIINPVFLCLFVFLIVKIASDNGEIKVGYVALTSIIVWFFLPDQYITQFLICGSANYIWASVFILSLLWLIKKNRSIKNNWIKLIIIIYVFFVGTWSEMYDVCVIPALVCYYWLNRNKVVISRE